jgi:hypothetical protein
VSTVVESVSATAGPPESRQLQDVAGAHRPVRFGMGDETAQQEAHVILRLQIADCRLQIADCRLISDWYSARAQDSF